MIIIALLFSFCPTEADAQVMFKGTKLFGVKGGIPYRTDPFYQKGSWRLGLEYDQYLNNGHYFSLHIDVEENKIPYKEVVINDFSAVAGASYNLYLLGDYTRTFNLYASAGLGLGYEGINKGEREVTGYGSLKKANAFLYGGKVGAHTDIYITNRLLFTAGLGTHLLWGNVSGNVARPYFEAGLKFAIW